jgi:hypothetical protein
MWLSEVMSKLERRKQFVVDRILDREVVMAECSECGGPSDGRVEAGMKCCQCAYSGAI